MFIAIYPGNSHLGCEIDLESCPTKNGDPGGDIMKPVTSLYAKKGIVEEMPELRQVFDDTKEAIQRKINAAAFDITRAVLLITDA